MIRKAKISDSKEIALLHKEGIPTGFLSSLDTKYLSLMYEIIIEDGFCFVAEENSNVIGFISGTVDSKALYKKIISKNLFKLMPLFIKNIFSLSFIRKGLNSFLIPFKTGKEEKNKEEVIPELLSIVISKNIQSKGIGTKLLIELESDLKQKGFTKYKVIAGDNLVSANKFYLKNGFVLSEQIELHKGQVSNIYIKELSNV